MHGFLGPNGAGKSTTLRALLGLLRTDAGTLRLLGGDPWRDATRLHRQLAYVPGDVSLWPNLSGGEVIDLLIRLRGGDPADVPTRRAPGPVRARPDEEGPRLLQGQPAEGGAGRGARQRRAAAAAGRADVRPGPADGAGVRGAGARVGLGRTHGPALQPHPQRGGGALRPGHDHPGRPGGGDRFAGRPAAPASYPRAGGAARLDGRDRLRARPPRRGRRRRRAHLYGGPRGDQRPARKAGRHRRAGPDLLATVARGALPRRLPDAGDASEPTRSSVPHGCCGWHCGATACCCRSGWRHSC